tara:strand:+ start:1007 stop:1504 length:498 start_codon:yes stop_codon:yes gene_type:complete
MGKNTNYTNMSLHDILIIKLKQDLFTKCKEYQEDIANEINEDVLHRLIESRTQDVVFDFKEDKCDLRKEERCCGRTWSHMKGLQCSNKRLDGKDYCGHHSNEIKREGLLRFDDIRREPPKFDLIKLKSNWIEKLNWRPSGEQELQYILDEQSRKVVFTTPKLILQ